LRSALFARQGYSRQDYSGAAHPEIEPFAILGGDSVNARSFVFP